MKVLVVDDDPDIIEAIGICFALRWPDAEVVEAPDGHTAIRKIPVERPDVVILDVGLPDTSGLEVCARIREKYDLPIIMLTARDGELDKVKGLEVGADDYITKPFSHLELLARIKAVLRRASIGEVPSGGPPFVRGQFEIDYAMRRVLLDGHRVALTPTEYNLLYHLARNFPAVVPHRTLLAKVWGRDYVDESDYLKVHVQRIRAKFGQLLPAAELIVNERGVGYRLNLEEESLAAS